MYQFLVLKLKIQFVNEKYFENLLIFRLRRSYNCLVCGCLHGVGVGWIGNSFSENYLSLIGVGVQVYMQGHFMETV